MKFSKSNHSFSLRNRRAMTLIEILIVVSLVSLISIALYSSLANGIKVWEVSRRIVVEEDIAVFFDKLAEDLRNSFAYATIGFDGADTRLAFPTIVHTPADKNSGLPEDEYVDQIGRVEYYFDLLDRGLYKRQANYGQAAKEEFGEPRLLVAAIRNLRFRYFYYTDDGEIYSEGGLTGIPSAVEVSVEFSDNRGQRVMQKFIDIPVGS